MLLSSLTKLLVPFVTRNICGASIRTCHSVFGIKDLITQEKLENFTICQVDSEQREQAMELIKCYCLAEHVLVRARGMHLTEDKALDEYLYGLLKQGNTMFALAEDDSVAGICVGFASSPVDARNLRNYAFYRQDPNTKDFLYFTAKLQETPNLWETFKQPKIFEIKMLAVLPEYRRQGLAAMMVEKAKEQAHDQGYNVVRMDCINPYDYKVAERCMLQCIVRFPLHRLRGNNAPFVKRSSKHNCCVRVYVGARSAPDAPDMRSIKEKQPDLESLIE